MPLRPTISADTCGRPQVRGIQSEVATMRRVPSMIALLLGLVACQPRSTAKLYSVRRRSLAVEYLVYAIDDEPENEELRAEAALVLERARWQLRNDLASCRARSPGAVIAKWRALQV